MILILSDKVVLLLIVAIDKFWFEEQFPFNSGKFCTHI